MAFVAVPPVRPVPLPDPTGTVVVRTPLIAQSASAADPRLQYGPPLVPATQGLTPSYLPNQRGQQVYMPYSSATGPTIPSNSGLDGDTNPPDALNPPVPTDAPTTAPPTPPPEPRLVLLPAPPTPAPPFYQNPTTFMAVCLAGVFVAIVVLMARKSVR